MKKTKAIWNALLATGTGALEVHNPQRRITMGVNLMTLSIALLNVTIGVFVFFLSMRISMLLGVIAETLLLAVPLLFNHYKRYNLASLSVYLIMTGATLYFGSLLGKMIESQLMITYLIGVSLFMFSKRRLRVFSIALAVFVLVFIEYNYKYQLIKELNADEPVRPLIRWAAYTAMITLVIITFHLYWRNDRALRMELQQYAKKVEDLLEKEAKENKNKDRFLSNASHEMKTSFKSIFAIIGNLYRQARELGSRSLERSIHDLRTAGKISESINDNIFVYEKYKAGLITRNRDIVFDVRVLFSRAVEVFSYMAEEQHLKIECHVHEDTPRYILSDDLKIRHIFSNLLQNAIKYSPEDSVITVDVEASGNFICFAVEDQGEGIQSGGADIFEPFITQNPEGLGLGLFIVKELVTALKGKIDVTSDSGGSRFAVFLPLQPLKQAEEAVQFTN